MTDISIETPNGSIDAVLEIPSGDGPWPGVVVIHDAFGLREPHREIVRQIAGNGFLAVAPNLFARGGMVRCMRAVMKDLIAYEGQAFEDFAAAWELLSSRSDCTGAIGIAGFCMGGMFTLLKVRPELQSYEDPGWYVHPPGTVSQPATAEEMRRDGIKTPV